MSKDKSLPKSLRNKMDSCKAYLKRLALYKGLSITLIWLLAIYLLSLLLDRSLHLPARWRFLLLTFALSLSVINLIFFCLRPFFRKYKDEHIALAVEKKYPQLKDHLISAVELFKNKDAGMSSELIQAVGKRTSQESKELDFRIAAPLRKLKIVIFSLLIIVAGVFSYALIFPEATANVLVRLLIPYGGIVPLTYTKLRILPGNTIVPKAEDIKISIFTEGKNPPWAKFFWKSSSSAPQRIALERDKNEGFHYLLRKVRQPIFYWVRTGDAYSRRYLIEVTDRPVITDIKVEYTYPEYTGLKKEISTPLLGDISVLRGSKIRLFAQANKEVVSADLKLTVANKEEILRMEVEKRNLEGPEISLLEPSSYSIQVKDKYGFLNRDPAKHRMKIYPDKPPRVKIQEPESSLFILPDERIKVKVVAEDDFGVDQLFLVYNVIRKEAKGVKKEISLASGDRRSKELKKDYLWAIEELEVKPGDIIEYYAAATDYDNLKGPNKGKSVLHHLYVISQEERWEQILDLHHNLAEKLSELIEKQKRAYQRVKDSSDKELDLEKLKKIAEEEYAFQRGLKKESSHLSQELQELMKKMAENNIGIELLSMLDYIQQQLQNVAKGGISQALEYMLKAAKTPTSQLLDNASAQQLAALEKLNQLLKKFFALIPGQKMDQLLKEAIELALRQDKVKKDTRSLVPEMLGREVAKMPDKERTTLLKTAQEQGKLGQDTANFMEKLQKIAEEFQYMNTGPREGISQAYKRLDSQKVPHQMGEVSELLEKNRLVLSLPKEDQLSQILWEVVEDLQKQTMGIEGEIYSGADMEQLYKSLVQLLKIIEEQKRVNQDTIVVDALRISEELPPDLKRELKKLAKKEYDIKELTKELQKLIPARNLSLAEDKMGQVHTRLAEGESGPRVQKIEKEIIDLLTDMLQSTAQQMMALGQNMPGSALIMALGANPGGYFTMAAPPAKGELTRGGSDAWSRLPSHLKEQLLELKDEEYPEAFKDLLILYYRRLGKE